MADHETVQLLARLGEHVFVPLFVIPPRTRFPDHADEPIDALKLFLSSYGFEHEGRSSAYGELATAALGKCAMPAPTPTRAASWAWSVWKTFCELGGFKNGKGANPKLNPLYSGRPADGHGIISVVFSDALEQDGYNLYRFAIRALKSDDLERAHTTLRSIRGTGPKIASLFLRDVALERTQSDTGLRHRELLQPIDIWTRRTISNLIGREIESDQEAARLIVQLADDADCCALSLNAGSWYFGSKIARTAQTLEGTIRNGGGIKRAIAKHAEQLHGESQRLGDVLGQ